MTFNTYFRASSYLMVACGALALAVSGGTGAALAAGFALVLILAWKLEGAKWQLSERAGLLVVLISLPLFYLDWKFQFTAGGERGDRAGVGALAHFILFLSSVKLLQVKADRDWLFLYLISFFEVLLAAGLSISPRFFLVLSAYLFCALSTGICFEIKKARRKTPATETRFLFIMPDSRLMKRLTERRRARRTSRAPLRLLPFVALFLLMLILALALPIFLITPRFGGSALARSTGGVTGMIGFSDEVTLGEIGRLQQNDQVVMRVRVEKGASERPAEPLRWRGVALDYFSGRAWRRSTGSSSQFVQRNEHDLFQFGTTEALSRLTTQTFFVEPMDTPVLFAAPRVIALQGALPYVRRDSEGALQTREHAQERLSYRAYSDTEEPPETLLRADHKRYTDAYLRYLQLPPALDPGVAALAERWTDEAGARNRYDKARVIEAHLRQDFGYTLQMRAGGPDPLADFLFRVRAGHCEYFATAMAVMLRTQGIATRVVNGFQAGEYNDAADAYTVPQHDAHSWVEVYFPGTESWVTFDPTPAAGRPGSAKGNWLSTRLSKYAEALELLWVQYVVAYDRQEQRSLANSLRSRIAAYHDRMAERATDFKAELSDLWQRLFADDHGRGSARPPSFARWLLLATLAALALLLLAWYGGRRMTNRRASDSKMAADTDSSTVTFYEQMTRILKGHGLERQRDQTPLEFADAMGLPEVLIITRAYHRVRYGAQNLSATEAAEIENCLRRIESDPVINATAGVKG